MWFGFKSQRDAICEMSLLPVLYFAPRGFFSPCTPVLLTPQKPTFPNFNSTRNSCAASKSLFIYLFQLFIYSFFLLFFLQSTCEVDSSICDNNEVCIPNYQDNSVRCVCKVGYTGTPCSKLHKKYGYVINCL